MAKKGGKRQQDKYDFLVKVVIIGDSAVGKTNVLLRFVNEEYKMSHITTIGVDFKIKTLNVDGTRIKMQIWDTAGQERFKTITQTYYKGSAGIILVYSVTDRKTFNNIQNWLKQINLHNSQDISKIIVGNKIDCTPEERQVSKKQGQQMAAKYGLKHMQTSAKENLNINDLFNTLAQEMKSRLKDGDKEQNKNVMKLNSNSSNQTQKDKKCC